MCSPDPARSLAAACLHAPGPCCADATGRGGIRHAAFDARVQHNDPAAFAKGIATLLAQPQLRRSLAMRGRRGVVASLSWERVAEATAGIYAEVLEERRGRPASTITSASDGAARATQSTA